MANYVTTEKKIDEGIDLIFYSNVKSYMSGFDEYVAPPFIERNRNAGKSPLCCHQVYLRIPDLQAVLLLSITLFLWMHILFELCSTPSTQALFALTSPDCEKLKKGKMRVFCKQAELPRG